MTQSKKKPAARKSSRSTTTGVDKLYVDQVSRLVDMMVANDLTNLEIVNGDLKVSLGRGAVASAAPAPASYAPPAAPAPVAAAAASPAPSSAAPAAKAEEGLLEVTSPMVGVFYAASSPDSAPYVKVGDKVSGETVVCIVEAMKVMNEITAECSGEIVEICVANGKPVEFGQVLFRVRP